jgi:glycine dehydrogenase subunit 2
MYNLQEMLAVISGMDYVTLQPVAGAHGEFTALLLFRAYHLKNKQTRRKNIIIPDSAHGTNPASVTLAGFNTVKVPSNPQGGVDIEKLAAVCDDETAGFMLTNPSTLGLFESNVEKIAAIVHECGGLLYMDGANLNAFWESPRRLVSMRHFKACMTSRPPHAEGGRRRAIVSKYPRTVFCRRRVFVKTEKDRYLTRTTTVRFDW